MDSIKVSQEVPIWLFHERGASNVQRATGDHRCADEAALADLTTVFIGNAGYLGGMTSPPSLATPGQPGTTRDNPVVVMRKRVPPNTPLYSSQLIDEDMGKSAAGAASGESLADQKRCHLPTAMALPGQESRLRACCGLPT